MEIVKSTLSMAHSLGLTVVAEGVEDEEALSRLKDMGCDVAQGYHIAMPMPPGELKRWFSVLLDNRCSCSSSRVPTRRV